MTNNGWVYRTYMPPDANFSHRHQDTYSIRSQPLSPARRLDQERIILRNPPTLILPDPSQQLPRSEISRGHLYRVGLLAAATAMAILQPELRLHRARVEINHPTGEKPSQDQTSPPQRNVPRLKYQLQRLAGAGAALSHLASMVIDRIDRLTLSNAMSSLQTEPLISGKNIT